MKDNELIGIFMDNYEKLSIQAIKMTGNKQDALDVLQDLALSIIENDLPDDINIPIAYMRTCIRNSCLNANKKKHRAMATDPCLLQSNGSNHSEYQLIEMKEWIDSQFSSYSADMKDAFIMHYIDGYPLSLVAKELGMTPNALSQQFKRMKKKVLTNVAVTGIFFVLSIIMFVYCFGQR